MAEYCCKCGKKLGIFFAKYQIGDQMFCGECANTIKINTMGNSNVCEIEDAIVIGTHHVSSANVHINCEIKYLSSKCKIICETCSTRDPAPQYEILSVPADINTADKLEDFIKSQGPFWFDGLSLDVKQRVDATFKNGLEF